MICLFPFDHKLIGSVEEIDDDDDDDDDDDEDEDIHAFEDALNDLGKYIKNNVVLKMLIRKVKQSPAKGGVQKQIFTF